METEKRWITSRLLFTAVSEQLAAHRQAAFTVTGMSMWPFLCHGRDQVVVEEPGPLRRGDIVLYRVSEQKYILHRITRLTGTTFQTTGDGNFARDPELPRSCIVARVCSVVRKGRTLACSSFRWRALSRLWMALFPLRPVMFSAWFAVRKYIRR